MQFYQGVRRRNRCGIYSQRFIGRWPAPIRLMPWFACSCREGISLSFAQIVRGRFNQAELFALGLDADPILSLFEIRHCDAFVFAEGCFVAELPVVFLPCRHKGSSLFALF